jgi:phosphomannomutase
MKKLSSIEKRCASYLLEEPDENLRVQIITLLETNSESSKQELVQRMGHHLLFGTAGLRAKMEAGYNRMNRVSVYRFSYALGRELCVEQEKHSPIVIGFDGRKNSQLFALEVASTLCMLGADVYLFEWCIPTPLCAYAVKMFQAKAGVMITASHNPGYDNGIKLFNQSSAQASGQIIKRIETSMSLAPNRSDFRQNYGSHFFESALHKIGNEIFDNYLRDIKQTQFFSQDQISHDLNVVYTPLHGVGKFFFLETLRRESFNDISVVPEQSEPDGQFPTVIFPNPEEDHTLDLAYQFAHAKKSTWVFAHDPDADRLQVSCLDSCDQFRKLSGNEMGAIFGYFAIKQAKEKGIKPLLASSIVSSRMLKAICDGMGAQYVEALTGFSNIVDAALKKQATSGHQFIFGYEEAIGFLIGQVVLDKDGIHAGVRFMEIAGYLSKSMKTVWQFLDELYEAFGIFVNDQWSIRFDGINPMEKITKMMHKVRNIHPQEIAHLLDQSECTIVDLQKDQSYYGINADVVIFEIYRALRLIVRPSGTEPKVKFYLELFEPTTHQATISHKKSLLRQKIVELKSKITCLLRLEAKP